MQQEVYVSPAVLPRSLRVLTIACKHIIKKFIGSMDNLYVGRSGELT